MGSPQFVDWIWEAHTNGSEQVKELPREQRIVGRPSLEEIFDEEMTREERDVAIKFARFRCGYLTTEIAKYVGLERSVVGRISRGKYGKNTEPDLTPLLRAPCLDTFSNRSHKNTTQPWVVFFCCLARYSLAH